MQLLLGVRQSTLTRQPPFPAPFGHYHINIIDDLRLSRTSRGPSRRSSSGARSRRVSSRTTSALRCSTARGGRPAARKQSRKSGSACGSVSAAQSSQHPVGVRPFSDTRSTSKLVRHVCRQRPGSCSSVVVLRGSPQHSSISTAPPCPPRPPPSQQSRSSVIFSRWSLLLHADGLVSAFLPAPSAARLRAVPHLHVKTSERLLSGAAVR